MTTTVRTGVGRLTREQRARLHEALSSAPPAGRRAPIARRPDPAGPAPLSPAQRRLWILSNLDPDNSAYDLASLFRVSGRFDEDTLRAALDALERRHEILRTVYRESEDGEPQQWVLPPRGAPLYRRDFSTLPKARREAALRGAVLDESNVRFDLRNGPVWRVALIRLAECESALVVNVHHIAFDGWSLGVLIRELFRCYRELRATGRPGGAPLAYQYADYSIWNNRQLDAALRGPQQDFWKRYLDGVPPLLELPLDRPRPERPEGRGAIEQLIVPRALFDRLCALGKSEHATPFNVFMALFKVLLLRHTGQSDLVLGTPYAGRDRDDTHELMGVFANTLPIRTRVASTASFREVLRAVRATALEAFAHADLPFDEIVEATRPARLPGCNPVFQVMFAYQNKVDPVTVDDLFVIYEIFDPGTTKFDLSLDIFEGPEGPTCLFEYDVALFDRARIVRMVRHFENLARQVLEHPDLAVGRLDYMTAEERRLVLSGAAAVKRLPYQASFVEVFDACVDADPQAPAVVDLDRQLSYRELRERADRLAAALQRRGIARGDVVGVCLPKGLALIEALLAVLKAGAAFVVLDPAHPAQRLAHVVRDAGARAVIGRNARAGRLDGIGAPVLDPHALHEEASTVRHAASRPSIAPGDPAYVVYTSGTTGKPKGTVITHRNWLNALHGWVTVYGLQPRWCHLQMASLGFDVFCGDFIRALGSGGTLVLCPPALLGDPAELHALMVRERIDCAEFVPAVFRPLAEHVRESGQRLDFMKVLIVASDSWYLHEYDAFRRLVGERCRLINSYGMAEASIDSTWFETESVDAIEGLRVPIGRPFPNVEVYVLDADLQPVAPGIVGEICVGGWDVAGGYLNNPELTAQRFVPHPFLREPGARLYRSGDLGCWRADGQLELLGRGDQQVKIRGQRVELAEIEMALLRHPAVRECAVVARESGAGDKRLVAYFVLQGGAASPAADALRAHLQDWVPPYMLPEAFVDMTALPLSANGKVDRKALPEPALPRDAAGAGAPRTLTEEILATIWCDVLTAARVGIHDSFFMLGGHSLLAFQMIARIRKALGVELPIQALFQHPTIAELAALIAERRPESSGTGETPAAVPALVPDPANRHAPFPLTPVQEAYWLGRRDDFEMGNVSAHSYDEFELPTVDPARFERAWNRVIRRHDMLRAVVRSDGTQQVLPEVPDYRVPVVDLRDAAPVDVESGLAAVRAALSHQILDVTTWPAFDVRLSLLPGNKARAHFSTDAIMFDVRSFLLVLEDLVRHYVDEDYAPAPIALTFRDYVLAEQALRAGPRYRRALEYWRRRAAGLPPSPDLPLARDPSQVARPHFTRLHATLEPEPWQRLKRRAMAAGLTPTGALLAAYAEVLARYGRSRRFSLNLTFLNRHPLHPQVDEVVGEFTSLTMLSVDGTGLDGFVERARKIQSDLWSDLEHNDISGVQVLREIARLSGEPNRARMPVVFTSALVVPMPEQRSGLPVTAVHRDGITQTSQVWLDCGVWEQDGVLCCNWDVVKEMYPEGFIESMFEAFWGLVRRLADDAAIWARGLLPWAPPPAEQDPQPIAIVDDAAASQTLVSLFLRQLAGDGGRCAVEAGGRRWTYRQLAGHAAWVAARLRERRVARGALVAVAMHKGWEQAAATLGIMASGAAYMPIDPDAPAARVRALLAQGGVGQLLTQPELRERYADLDTVEVLAVGADALDDPRLLASDTEPGPDDLAYVIYTSGSTGTPKGVMIEHRGAVNTLLDINARLGITAGDAVLAVSALNFDLSVYDLFGLFAAGGRVVFPDHDRRLDPQHWLELVRARRITVWNSVPALMGLLADHAEALDVTLPSLRQVLLSGDWIPVTLPARIRALADGVAVTALGGATEASIWSILYPVGEVDPAWPSIPYGRAMQRQGMYVLNERLEPCPAWVAGDVYIGGVGLARGYYKDGERTAAAFVTHPRTGARLYRTGDLGRWLPDGNMEFLGRDDLQVKVQGHRIELGEIETLLRRHAAVKEAVVAAVGQARGAKRLVAYLVARDGEMPDPDAMRGFLASQLPEYMVPQVWRVLDRLPLSANGKVDRKALPAPEIDASAAAAEGFIAPRTEAECRLAKIWTELLDIERVGVHDNFFGIGGDSMAAIRMIARARSALGGEWTLSDLFRSPTIAALVRRSAGGAAEPRDALAHKST